MTLQKKWHYDEYIRMISYRMRTNFFRLRDLELSGKTLQHLFLIQYHPNVLRRRCAEEEQERKGSWGGQCSYVDSSREVRGTTFSIVSES